MKKVIVLFVIVIMAAGNAFGMLATSTTDDYTVYITVKPYVYSTGFCWYTQFKVKNNATKAYMYVFTKDKTLWNKYFEQSDFSDFSLTEGTSETNANSIYWKAWTAETDYLKAFIWSYNAALQIIGKIQTQGKNCSLSISKTAFLDNRQIAHLAPESLVSGAGECTECEVCSEDGDTGCIDVGYSLYNTLPTRFTDNGNGTVTDSATGLMWQKQIDELGGVTQTKAVYNCGIADTGGYTDWRLASYKEILSAMSFPNPVFPAGMFLSGSYSDVWTSDMFMTDNYFYISTSSGVTRWTNKSWIYGYWCVRDAE